MNRILLSGCYFSFVLLSACSPVDSLHPFDQQQAALLLKENSNFYPAQQLISLPLPHRSNWQRIDVSYGTVGTPIMLVPINENERHWTQSIRTQIRSYERYPAVTANHFFYDEMNYERDYCSYVEGNIIEQHKAYDLFSLSLGGCSNQPNQQQYGKIFNGQDAVYVVYYSWISGIAPNPDVKQAITYASLVTRRKD